MSQKRNFGSTFCPKIKNFSGKIMAFSSFCPEKTELENYEFFDKLQHFGVKSGLFHKIAAF